MVFASTAVCFLLLQSPPPEQGAPTAPPAAAPAPTPSPDATKPDATKPEEAKPADKPAEKPAEKPAGLPTEAPADKPTRAYIVVDRISTAAGTIESDDDTVIVIRDEKGRVRSFTKSRVISITYLLDGPAGRRVRAVLNDGHTLVGNLVEDGYAELAIEIQGVTAKYPREAVAEVKPYPTDQEFYERFRKSIEPDQYGARYSLALWLYQRKMYEESKRELESLLESTPHFEARQLLTEVNAQLKLMQPVERPTQKPAREPDAGTRRPKDDPKAGLLSEADVNLIRVYEIDLARPPRLQVPDTLIAKLLERYSDNTLIPAKQAERNSFYAKDPVEIVKTLFALKARDLYGEVRVLGEPESLNLFRQRVHNTWVINNCATSRCHGGPDGGRLFLYNSNHKDEQVRTTNLLILTRTTLDGLPLIDFEKPTDSLAYQYALPTTEARRPHPEVRGWEPVFTSGRRGLQEDFVNWVRSMKIQRGEYPSIEYTPPGLKRPDRQMPGGPDR